MVAIQWAIVRRGKDAKWLQVKILVSAKDIIVKPIKQRQPMRILERMH